MQMPMSLTIARWAVSLTLALPLLARADLVGGIQDLLSNDKHEWEGAIGVVGSYGPDYAGATNYGFSVKPALFLRYGRFSLTTGAGFVTRRADEVPRGLGADLVVTEDLRLNLAARLDRGRDESASPQLQGMGDVPGTVRVRVMATWRPLEHWVFNGAVTVDALGRGQGLGGELAFARETWFSAETLWTWGGSVTMGNQTNIQTYYGVTPAQSASSGYPVYTPNGGLTGVALSTGIRSELFTDWVGFFNVGVSQTLGPLNDSPLVTRPFGFGANTGIAWRF